VVADKTRADLASAGSEYGRWSRFSVTTGHEHPTRVSARSNTFIYLEEREMSGHITHPGIIVGVDGSPASKMAVDWAARDAAMRNVPLTLVHALPAPAATWPATPVPAGFQQWQPQQAQQILADATTIAEAATEQDGPAQVDREVLYSTAVSALVDLSKDAAMAVVGCRGSDALHRTLLGSVSSGLVHRAHCPVAVIHDWGHHPLGGEDPPMPHPAQAPVLVGIDGSPASALATAIAFDEASVRGVDLVALHACSDMGVCEFPDLDWPTMKVVQLEFLARLLAPWQECCSGVTVRRLVVVDRPARRLVEESKSAQLVVVGSHGRGGFAGMLLGSVSAAVAQSARVPVIVARQR
jgi:nucleotide-binding universal stress UspA family protein